MFHFKCCSEEMEGGRGRSYPNSPGRGYDPSPPPPAPPAAPPPAPKPQHFHLSLVTCHYYSVVWPAWLTDTSSLVITYNSLWNPRNLLLALRRSAPRSTDSSEKSQNLLSKSIRPSAQILRACLAQIQVLSAERRAWCAGRGEQPTGPAPRRRAGRSAGAAAAGRGGEAGGPGGPRCCRADTRSCRIPIFLDNY